MKARRASRRLLPPAGSVLRGGDLGVWGLGILADGVLVLTGKPLGEVEGDADLVGDAGLELRHLKGMDAGGIVGILRLEAVVVGEGSQTVGNGGVECLLRGDGFKFCHEKTSILTDAYKNRAEALLRRS